jgi:hypothetical protein
LPGIPRVPVCVQRVETLMLVCLQIRDKCHVGMKFASDFGEYGAALLASGQVRHKFFGQLHLLEFIAGFRFSIARHRVLPN